MLILFQNMLGYILYTTIYYMLGGNLMPIKIPNSLPATEILNNENIFVMTETRALKQDIRPLKILLLNLMPTKIVTETQLLRILGNTPLQVEVELMQTSTYSSKNTPSEHLLAFYKTFDQVKHKKFDGLIITGAPIENLEFEEVDYWDELVEIMAWSKKNIFSTLHICWGAQAGLYYHYGIPKYPLDQKMFGVFEHDLLSKKCPLMRGIDDRFYIPHSRHTEVRRKDIMRENSLELLAHSKEAGVYAILGDYGRQIFLMGHCEYDANTLATEYFRDLDKNLEIDMPKNYFPDNNPQKQPLVTWRSTGNLLFSNWLNYYVYQTTPYNLEELD